MIENKYILNEYKEKGYFLFKNFFNKKMDFLHDQILKIFEIKAKENNIKNTGDNLIFELAKKNWDHYIACCHAARECPYIYNYGTSSKVLNLLKKIGLKLPNLNIKPLLLFSSKELATHKFYWKTEAHQDYQRMMGSLDSVVLWAPISKISKNMGYLQIVEGSHLEGLHSHTDSGPGFFIKNQNERKWKSIVMNRGDLLVFSSFLLHRSGLNQSKKIRMTATWRYDNLFDEFYCTRDFFKPFDHKIKDISFLQTPKIDQIRKVFK